MPTTAAPQSLGIADNTPLLTIADIRQLQADLDADVRLLAELPARIEAKRQRLDAARQFLPEGYDLHSASIGPSPRFENQKTTWISAVFGVLNSMERGIPHKELLTKIIEKHPTLEQSQGDKGFYNAVARLAKGGEITKFGGLLYSTRVVNLLREKGEKLPDMTLEVRRRAGGSAQIVIEILEKHPGGLSGPDLKKVVAEIPEAPKSVREHGQYIYNILATLMGSGVVTKKDGIYRLKKTKG